EFFHWNFLLSCILLFIYNFLHNRSDYVKKLVASTILAASILTPTIVNAEANVPFNVFAEKKVEIRRGATNSYQSIATITNGIEVKVIDEFTNTFGEKWYRI